MSYRTRFAAALIAAVAVGRLVSMTWLQAMAPDLVVYSAIMHSDDHMVSVGYKPLDEINVEERLAKINIRDNKWAFAKAQVIEMILQTP